MVPVPRDKTVRKTSKKRPTTRHWPQKPYTHIHCIGFLLFIAFLLSLFIGGTLYLFILLDIPDIKSIQNYRPYLTTRILDAKGQVVTLVYKENRILVSLKQMPDLLPKAFVAAEDARFYQHQGVDLWSIFRALAHNLMVGGRSQGGSTITQQMTRSLLLSRKKLYSRKIKEAILAYRIDSLLTKEDILFIYLNQIYLGEGAHGVEAAANTYFDKHVSELSLAEIAVLAGLPKAPSRYSPLNNMKLAKKRQAYVLNRMAEEGYITPAAARAAFNQPLQLARHERTDANGYFVQYVQNYAENKYGEDMVLTGGLTIYTTLDQDMQKIAADSIKKGVSDLAARRQGNVRSAKRRPGKAPQGSLVVLEHKTGRIRAMVGGTDFTESQFNRAVQARRQPGSAFKPIVFAAALEKGFTPATLINDKPLRLPGPTRNKIWEPKNFDGKFNGPTTLRAGLIDSRNIVAIRLLQEVGVDPVIKLARKMGIGSPLARNLSLALGSSGVSLLELVAAYGTFGNGGRYIQPISINKITDRDGKILEKNTTESRPILDARTAYQVTLMLKGVIKEGTGKAVKGLDTPVAGKTGTTDHYMDAWFIGYTPELAIGVWVGYDQKRTLGRGETGGHVAAPIWRDFVKAIEKNNSKKSTFKVPG